MTLAIIAILAAIPGFMFIATTYEMKKAQRDYNRELEAIKRIE